MAERDGVRYLFPEGLSGLVFPFSALAEESEAFSVLSPCSLRSLWFKTLPISRRPLVVFCK